ncbi:hypothetical protein OS493_003307 [Desmophyllum pertusum]|uniref:C-type lectin domain-containing protein n=1 Tax=Desmophyllum pertusum TaxID=174260 RepID=A0A9X0A568_9CNID|nr:hypothetical protein OS493_003307 [Desmophyllum pertusum]
MAVWLISLTGRSDNFRFHPEHCVSLWAKRDLGSWLDESCDIILRYICEKPANGMSCYQCSSNTSFADCTKKQELVTVRHPVNYCYKRKNEIIGIKDEEVVVFR